ncbi:uncharacterized protein LOC142518366 [Primulina tabacum]|uniref:uncharacterized protein LOC142518366 n=1 Tax=Primulina tabacum TaxID=48773 RepID=UPI003F59B789
MVMRLEILFYFQWILLCNFALFAACVCSKKSANAATDLAEIINNNRTSPMAPKLSVSPGLGCIALQYANACKGNCSSNNTITCQPPEDYFTEIFAPNCGVELPTFGTISGHILGCQKTYLEPSEAYSRVLVLDPRTLSLSRNRTFTQVGVGILGGHKGKGPYIWCVLFSNSQRNTTFVLENLGKGIVQTSGCYSGTSLACSAGHRNSSVFFILSLFIFTFYCCKLIFS